MEEQKKEETLSRLYALRAGLSAITLEKDQADRVFDDYEQEKSSIQTKLGKIRQQKSELDKKISDLEKEVQENKSSISSCEEGIEDSKRSLKKPAIARIFDYFTAKAYLFLICLFCALICIGSYISFGFTGKGIIGLLTSLFATEGSESSYYVFELVFAIIGGLAFIGGTGVCAESFGDALSDYGYHSSTSTLKGKIRKAECEKIQYIKELNFRKEELERCTATLPQLDQEADKLVAEMEQKTDEQKKSTEIVRHVEAGNLLNEALQREYGTLISARDWENLDYVIYMMETGRADSMKEALQLVDRARQTEEIIEAVESSSRMICSTLVESTRRLGMLFSQCTERLSLRIDGLSQQMDFANQNLTAQFSDMGKYVSSLTSEVALGNALQAKANETSLELAEEVHALKEHSDYADWRLRNSSYR